MLPCGMPDEHLAPASPDDLTQALAHALQFDGRKQFKVSGEMMAKITAAHLDSLSRQRYVPVRRPKALCAGARD